MSDQSTAGQGFQQGLQQGFDMAELARRSGCPPAWVDRLIELGVLSEHEGPAPFTTADTHLVRLLLACDRAGIPIEAVAEAVAAGRLSFAWLEGQPWSVGDAQQRTWAQLCDQRGLDSGRLQRLYQAAGQGLGLDEPVGARRSAADSAMCFLDLVGYTRLTEELGDAAAARLVVDLADVAQQVAAEYGGEPVKWLGDGVMFHFPEPGPAVVAALDLVSAVPEVGLPPAHVGLHAGPVVFQDGDVFGRTVNLASRIAAKAGADQVLVSDEVVEAASSTKGLRFQPVGPAELKGVAAPVALSQALPDGVDGRGGLR